MPLVGYHKIGFEKGPLSFTAQDLRLLDSDRHQVRVERFFARTPYRVNLFFHNRNWGERTFGDREKVYKEAREHAHIHLLKGLLTEPDNVARRREAVHRGYPQTWWERKNRFDRAYFVDHQPVDADAINFVYTSNEGASAFFIPMTPWTIAHRMGHIQMIVKNAGLNGGFFRRSLEYADAVLMTYYGYHLSCSSKALEYEWNVTLRPYVDKPHCDARVFHGLFLNLIRTRAGREHHLAPWFDYYAEWMAEFLNKDRIDIPEQMGDLDLTVGFQREQDKPVPYPGTTVLRALHHWDTTDFREMLEAGYRGVLDSWVGEVVVT